MVLTARITESAFNSLSEALQAEYKKTSDGNYIIDVQAVDGWNLEDVSGLKSALSSERERANGAEKKVKAFEGIDPKEAKDAIQKVKDGIQDVPDKDKVQAQIDSAVKQTKDQYEEKLKAEEQNNGQLTGEIQRLLVENAVTAGCQKHKASARLILPHVRENVKVERGDDGKFSVRVLGSDGNPLLSKKSGDTGNMTIEEYVGTLKDDTELSRAFEGSGNTGTGGDGGGAGGSGNNKIDPKLPASERLKELRRQQTGQPN